MWCLQNFKFFILTYHHESWDGFIPVAIVPRSIYPVLSFSFVAESRDIIDSDDKYKIANRKLSDRHQDDEMSVTASDKSNEWNTNILYAMLKNKWNKWRMKSTHFSLTSFKAACIHFSKYVLQCYLLIPIIWSLIIHSNWYFVNKIFKLNLEFCNALKWLIFSERTFEIPPYPKHSWIQVVWFTLAIKQHNRLRAKNTFSSRKSRRIDSTLL